MIRPGSAAGPHVRLLLAGVASLASLAGAASAAETASAGGATLEEVVVTATRREENLRDVPIAVTAVQAAALQQRQIVDVGGLQRLAPSLTVAPFGDSTSPLLSIRGLVAQDIVVSIDPAVGIYLDGVYLGRATGGNLSLVDVSRVEVLRGPQGTLFGRNTIGGAVSITPNHPASRFEGSFKASYGNFQAVTLTGVLNAPLSDGVAVRIAAAHREHDGYARSAWNGVELNAQNLDYVRGSLSADFGASWNLLASADFTDSRNNGQWITQVKSFPVGDLVAARVTGGALTARQFTDAYTNRTGASGLGPFVSRNWGGSATLTGKFGAAEFKSITAYRKIHRLLANFDQDGTPFDLLQIASNRTDQHQFSQEVQLFGKALEQKLDWIVGAYYFRENGRDEVIARFDYPLSPNYSINDGIATNRNYAVYGQLTYAFTDQLSITGGLRYAKDKRRLILQSRTAGATPTATIACAVSAAPLPSCRVALTPRSFSYVPFTVGLNYKPANDVLLYAKWSRGFRSGGFNSRGSTEQTLLPFDPEKVDSYELGTKLLLDRRFSLNVAAFQSNYKDIQILATYGIAGGISTQITQNAGTARVRGLEAEGEAAFGPLRLTAGLALLDAKYRSLLPGVIGLVQASPFTYTPKTAYSVAADYAIPTQYADLVLHVDYSWRSRTWFVASPPADPVNGERAYGLVNASITAKIGESLTASLYGKNLANKHYLERTTNLATVGVINGYPGDPRTYGVSIGYSF